MESKHFTMYRSALYTGDIMEILGVMSFIMISVFYHQGKSIS
ncbi:putative membrane protein [Bacteroides uniformis str. 3978 T3 ii]|uniref:Putative membrane protein n=1 Tax=Bacteroides uniformis str. 3978 T3 ii TaxID=1339349 RepID=A0A078SVR0_BACUN|nr:putative membrane protein [Bacteroides uniformis str. 3978 T3 ii]